MDKTYSKELCRVTRNICNVFSWVFPLLPRFSPVKPHRGHEPHIVHGQLDPAVLEEVDGLGEVPLPPWSVKVGAGDEDRFVGTAGEKAEEHGEALKALGNLMTRVICSKVGYDFFYDFFLRTISFFKKIQKQTHTHTFLQHKKK